jgi:hypothetical protein
MQILYIIVGILSVWVLILSIVVVLDRIVFKNLGKDIGKQNLIKYLEGLSQIEKQNSQAINDLKSVVDSVINKNKFHLQKISLLKFNPFEEVGGEHSFSLCMLNDNDTGVILTGLHTRDRTRVYLKEVKRGKAQLELSREESKVLRDAIGNK